MSIVNKLNTMRTKLRELQQFYDWELDTETTSGVASALEDLDDAIENAIEDNELIVSEVAVTVVISQVVKVEHPRALCAHDEDVQTKAEEYVEEALGIDLDDAADVDYDVFGTTQDDADVKVEV